MCDIGETEDIETSLTTTTGGIDREQDWPCDTAADEADDEEDLEEAEEEVAIQRAVIENVGVGLRLVPTDPAKHATLRSVIDPIAVVWLVGTEGRTWRSYCSTGTMLLCPRALYTRSYLRRKKRNATVTTTARRRTGIRVETMADSELPPLVDCSFR